MNDIIVLRKTRFLLQNILFTCLIQSLSAFNLTELTYVCDIRNAKTSEVTINTLPPYCTAASTSQNDQDDVLWLASLKTNKPFILFFNGFSYYQWETYLSYENQFKQYIITHKLDGIVFDYMYKPDKNQQFDSARNHNISKFLKDLRLANPDILYGLALPKDAPELPYAFDYNYLDPDVDFYVVKTINYRSCKYKPVMKRTTTVGDMRKSLDALRTTIPDMGKVLLTVQLYSIGVLDNQQPVILSYSDMCGYQGKELSVDRKYCKDSLTTLYEKGSLVPEYKLLGVYVQYIDFDDYAGSCRCGVQNADCTRFPGAAAISYGMGGNTTNQLLDCDNFGSDD